MLKPRDYRPELDGPDAVAKSTRIRKQAADLASNELQRPAPVIHSNKEEQYYADNPVSSFTKGLKHDGFGRVSQSDYEMLVTRLVGTPEAGMVADFNVPNGPGDDGYLYDLVKEKKTEPAQTRKWESPLGGLNEDIMGPSIAGVAMPPAPPLGSSELCAEMAEVYAMALLRDLSFEDLEDPNCKVKINDTFEIKVSDIVDELKKLSWFKAGGNPVSFDPGSNSPRPLNKQEENRRAARFEPGKTELTLQALFRGSSKGAMTGPYLSQFLLLGNGDDAPDQQKGEIKFGTQVISQKNVSATSNLDYMTEWTEWLDVQNGANHSGDGVITKAKFLTTLRDMASYVHIDQLYQAYFNAALLIIGQGKSGEDRFDAGFPNNKGTAREGFATWGGPHLLSLFAEVASRGLKAVRRQKFQVHRRCRPEVIAARLSLAANGHGDELGAAEPRIASMLDELKTNTPDLLKWINLRNQFLNEKKPDARGLKDVKNKNYTLPDIKTNYLLPMAFSEGSPMHPAYGAGHATVAGACVTILKAFLNTVDSAHKEVPLSKINMSGKAVHGHYGFVDSQFGAAKTVNGELDKLAANISIARNMAGVHYYSDYYESLRMGERIAVGMLQEQMIGSPEEVSMRLFDFDGRLIEIKAETHEDPKRPGETITTGHVLVDHDTMDYADWWIEHLPKSTAALLAFAKM